MYLWKAWHDTRDRLALYALATLCAATLLGLEVVSTAKVYESYFAITRRWSGRWDFAGELVLWQLYWVYFLGLRAALLTGLILGVSSVGRGYGDGTMPIVLTRPSARKNLVFADWAVGLTAIVIIVSGLAYGYLPFLWYVGAPGAGNILGVLPALWVVAVAVYGLGHFCTLVGGSASRGLILSAAIVLSYDFLPGALHDWWHVDAPLRATNWTLRIFSFSWNSWPYGPFAWGAMAFWLAVAVCFLGASVAWIRYREV